LEKKILKKNKEKERQKKLFICYVLKSKSKEIENVLKKTNKKNW